MTNADVAAICEGLPGAELTHPFGPEHDAWKVGGKIFAITASDAAAVTVKTSGEATARMLIDVGVGEKAAYLNSSWVRLPYAKAGAAEITFRITDSYRLIRGALTKKAQAALAPFPAEEAAP